MHTRPVSTGATLGLMGCISNTMLAQTKQNNVKAKVSWKLTLVSTRDETIIVEYDVRDNN